MNCINRYPLVEEVFQLYFAGATLEEPHEVLTCTEILMRFKKLSRAAFEVNQKTRLHLGKSLRKLNIQPHRTRKGSGYLVKQVKWD
ncbi:MAG: DUF3874 domain-containing protein [Tannerellaceae bacterium]|nr:DUF3874 domain-containing protein [Tannerellaceae bacterium]